MFVFVFVFVGVIDFILGYQSRALSSTLSVLRLQTAINLILSPQQLIGFQINEKIIKRIASTKN